MVNIYAPPKSPLEDLQPTTVFPKRPRTLFLLCIWMLFVGGLDQVRGVQISPEKVSLDFTGAVVIMIAFALLKGSNVARYLALLVGLIPFASRAILFALLDLFSDGDIVGLVIANRESFGADLMLLVPVLWICFASKTKHFFATKTCPSCANTQFSISLSHFGALRCKNCQVVIQV